MLLDDILDDLHLNHTIKQNINQFEYGLIGSGRSDLDQLDTGARDNYKRFLGYSISENDLWPTPDYIKKEFDQDTLNLCGELFARRVGLACNDNSDYGNDASAADFAMACDLLDEGFKHEDVEIIMRSTRYREKFDDMRGNTTYLARTINKAIQSIEQGNSSSPAKLTSLSLEQGRISIPMSPPPPRDYVWDKRIVAGHAYALGGFGGVSKSQAALQLAASIGLGLSFGDVATKKGSALLIFGEDDHSEISRRLGAYAAQSNFSTTQRRELERNIRALGLVGEDTRLTTTKNSALQSTQFSEKIIAAAVDLTTHSGEAIRLIVLDHAGLIHGGDFNAREDVSLTMRIINQIAHETGAAVLLLAHSPKAASGAESSDASAIAGSTTFVDQTRGAFILATMRKNEAKALGIIEEMRQQYVSMTVVKNNYGKTGDVSWFTRTNPRDWEVGVLVPVDLQPKVKSLNGAIVSTARIRQFVAEHPGQYSKTSLRKQSGKDGVLKASKPEVEAAIEEMLSSGELVTRKPTTEERDKFGLPQQTNLVLDVPIKEK